jgi:serine/threonine protein kinase
LAKKKLQEVGTVDEHGDSTMDSSFSSDLDTSSTPPAVVAAPTNVSIWESSFSNKVLVGSGSFFQTYRCQSCDREGHPDEYGEFFAVKRSIKEFRGKKDRGLYLREVAVMESIGQHENIVKHVRAWQEDLHFFIQMECQSQHSERCAQQMKFCRAIGC